MDDSGYWLTPLLLLPGAALLVLSTAQRYGRLHEELHHVLHHGEGWEDQVECFRIRAIRFHRALVWLYTSLISFGLSALLGGLTQFWSAFSHLLVYGGSFLGILAFSTAIFYLIGESRKAHHVIEAHLREIESASGKNHTSSLT